MLSRSLLAAAATAAAALTLTTAAASAQGPVYEVDYRVDFELTADWGLHRWEERGFDWQQETSIDGKTRITGFLEHVLFRNGELVTQTNMGPADQKASGSGYAETKSYSDIDDKWYTERDECEAGHDNAVASSRLQAHPEGGLVFRATDDASIGFVCDSGNRDVHLGLPGRVLGAGTFDARFTLPNEAIGMGKIIQHISATDGQRSPQYCPGKEDPFVDTCEFGWEGKLTFTRMDEHQSSGAPVDDGPDLPPVPVGPGVDPRAEAIRHIFEQEAKKPARIDPRAEAIIAAVEQYRGDLKLQTNCPTGCTGTAGLLIGSARKPIATSRFTAKPGTRSVTLRLSPKARKALRRATKATLRITTKPRGGGAPTKQTLRVKR